jgi:hypothetical protein
MVDDRAPWAAKPPTAAMFFPLRRIGRGGNSAARARLTIAESPGEARKRTCSRPALCGQKMAATRRTAADQSRQRH